MIEAIKYWYKQTKEHWFPSLVIDDANEEKDHSVYKDPAFRATTESAKFYVEAWTPNPNNKEEGGFWNKITFYNNGVLVRDFFGSKARSFETAEEACDIARRMIAGERYFREYDQVKFAVLDCNCLPKAGAKDALSIKE
jgi:hypothetical protein